MCRFPIPNGHVGNSSRRNALSTACAIVDDRRSLDPAATTVYPTIGCCLLRRAARRASAILDTLTPRPPSRRGPIEEEA